MFVFVFVGVVIKEGFDDDIDFVFDEIDEVFEFNVEEFVCLFI